MRIPFFQFRDFPVGLHSRVEQALIEELHRNQLILGPTVTMFEQEFSRFLGGGEVIGVGNGYDALVLSLKSLGVGPGDEVIVPANGYIATINAVQQLGAKPVFAEPDRQSFNLTAASVAPMLTRKTKAILPIHLYGQSCEMEELLQLCKANGIDLVEDFAQAQGALYKGNLVGTFGKINATSFYPTKNLGAAGDGGAVVTQDEELAHWVRQHHNYGQSKRYEYAQVGVNSRLDSLQAAVLREKLQSLRELNTERRRLAKRYHQALTEIGDIAVPTASSANIEHIYHLYVIRTQRRNELKQLLAQQQVQTLIHYPIPPHYQKAYEHLGYKKGDFPIAEELAETCLSLPLFPGMTDSEQDYVIEQIQRFFAS
ncbi:DegT/DnrJ/EryC1/StrS family aminotransferase [Sabulibacter ruber]|uniref:DegT/DnrJ/EryC1/StrS family aminotransferase n=1 Tax=Sabulibacter ruber TaxID=2811901 RepID=UPI001A95D28E|nr:DegT/DnrJ/EryC1/StrS family aminotransferase [Sabulibacter ruber]